MTCWQFAVLSLEYSHTAVKSEGQCYDWQTIWGTWLKHLCISLQPTFVHCFVFLLYIFSFHVLPGYLCQFFFLKTEMLELLIMCNGLGISCHSIINHFHDVAVTVNICTLTDNSALSKLGTSHHSVATTWLKRFQGSFSGHGQCMFMHDIIECNGPWRLFNHVVAPEWWKPKLVWNGLNSLRVYTYS